MSRPRTPAEPEWIPLRGLASSWRVNRHWLAGVAVGMGLVTSRGRNNGTLIRGADVAPLRRIVERAAVGIHG